MAAPAHRQAASQRVELEPSTNCTAACGLNVMGAELTLRAPSRPASMMGGGSSTFFDCVPFRSGPPAASSTGRGAWEKQYQMQCDQCANFIIKGNLTSFATQASNL